MKKNLIPIEIDDELYQYLENKTVEWSGFTTDGRIVFTVSDVIEGMMDDLYYPGMVL